LLIRCGDLCSRKSLPFDKRSFTSSLKIISEGSLRRLYQSPIGGCWKSCGFDEKDTLRDRGYRWRPAGLQNGKVWWTICPDKEAEIEWLHSKIYRYEKDIPTQEVTAINRYSNRLWDF